MSMKTTRNIIVIDEEKCDGCGNCVPACVEGALQIIDGKARLVKESYCDGLGACLGDCPQGALTVTQLEVDSYDEGGVLTYLAQKSPELVQRHVEHLRAHGMTSSFVPPVQPQAAPVTMCPSIELSSWREASEEQPHSTLVDDAPRAKSELRQWPVQLTLMPVSAPFLHQATLTLIADCVPFANPNMHADFIRGSAIAVGCPKLDDAQAYIGKLAQILASNEIRGLKVAYMEVPCCRGLVFIAQQALKASGKELPLEIEMVRIGD